MGFNTINPKEYFSRSGEFTLFVDPSNKEGRGESEYRLTRGKQQVWAKRLPYTLWDAAVTDEGLVAGYAYSLGWENRPADWNSPEEGKLHILIIDPRGEVRMNDVYPRRGVESCTSSIDRTVVGIILDTENDRFVVRTREGERFPAGETWRVYQVSRGELADQLLVDRPRKNERGWAWVRGAAHVRGTPLILVSWEYHEYDQAGNTELERGQLFTLLDYTGKTVWEYMHPSKPAARKADEPESKESRADDRRRWQIDQEVRRNGAILSTNEPKRFDVWLVEDEKRVAFEVSKSTTGEWNIAERSRTPFAPALKVDKAETATAPKLVAITPKHLGTIELKFDQPAAVVVRDTTYFDIDNRGRIGFVRGEKGQAETLVFVDEHGTVVQKQSLQSALPTRHGATRLTWVGGDRWLVIADEWRPKPSGEGSDAFTRAWWFDIGAGSLTPIEPFTGQRVRHLAGTGDGGFVASTWPTLGTQETYEIVAFDRDGRERWRINPQFNVIVDIAFTTDGRTIASHDYAFHSLSVTTRDGKVAEKHDARDLFGNESNNFETIIADLDGGLCLLYGYRSTELWRVGRDWKVKSKLKPRFPDGRPVEIAAGPDDRGLRVDAHGAIWATDGHSLVRLNADGVADRVLGEPPETAALRNVGTAFIDQAGNTYLCDERNATTHVFDAAGKHLRQLQPMAGDFQESGIRALNVAGDGTVMVSRLQFSPEGERLGWRPKIEACDDGWGAEALFVHPDSRRYWAIGREKIHLVSEGDKLLKTIERRPDGKFLSSIGRARVAADGSLVTEPGISIDRFAGEEADAPALCFYNRDGEPQKQVPIQTIGVGGFDGSLEAYNGRLVLMSGGTYEQHRMYMVDSCAEPPQWYDLGPELAAGQCFFVKNGKEIWLYRGDAWKVERYEINMADAAASAARP